MVETTTLSKEIVKAMRKSEFGTDDAHPESRDIASRSRGMRCKGPEKREWDGIYQTMHGGILATIADSVTCWAILTEIGAEDR